MASSVTSIERTYVEATPGSARLMERAARSMPRGLTRSLSWFSPYPVVFERGLGSHLWDVDGNRYIDLFCNGLSLMHGHAYEPIDAALRAALGRGTAWPGASDAQIEFAELLCSRLPGVDLVRFTNTGTEATMLAVKLARHVTGRDVVVKALHAYHGSFADLEVGLLGQGEIPGRAALAEFGDLESFRRALEANAGRVAAVMVEPVQFTGTVIPPPEGFLQGLAELCRKAGALFVIDDCLMFRLAAGGSADRFGVEADVVCLGKWVGGGLAVGVLGGSRQLMEVFDGDGESPLYHGGSFNGNLPGSVAGTIAVRDLTAESIAGLDARVATLKADLEAAGDEYGVPISAPGVGSAFGLYVLDRPGGEIDREASALLQLAAVNHGFYFGATGEAGPCTALSDEDVGEVGEAMRRALADLVPALAARA